MIERIKKRWKKWKDWSNYTVMDGLGRILVFLGLKKSYTFDHWVIRK